MFLQPSHRQKMLTSVRFLQKKNSILFLTTSNRWSGEQGGEVPKSTQLAKRMFELVGTGKVQVIDVTKLVLYPCEGNVSTQRGNTCGLKDALLKDAAKNPSGLHRCWASLNNADDELWKISKALLQSDAVVFFGSVRWGQMNSYYQRLLERLTWLENRHSTLGEDNVIKNISAGLIAVGHNWNEKDVLKTQKNVLTFFGFDVRPELMWEWHYTTVHDESSASYSEAAKQFSETFLA